MKKTKPHLQIIFPPKALQCMLTPSGKVGDSLRIDIISKKLISMSNMSKNFGKCKSLLEAENEISVECVLPRSVLFKAVQR